MTIITTLFMVVNDDSTLKHPGWVAEVDKVWKKWRLWSPSVKTG